MSGRWHECVYLRVVGWYWIEYKIQLRIDTYLCAWHACLCTLYLGYPACDDVSAKALNSEPQNQVELATDH